MLIDPGAGGKTRDACPLAPAHGGPLSLSPWQHPESSRINHTLVAWHLSPPAWPTAQHDMIKRPQAWSSRGGERLSNPTSLRSLTQCRVGDTELRKSSHLENLKRNEERRSYQQTATPYCFSSFLSWCLFSFNI